MDSNVEPGRYYYRLISESTDGQKRIISNVITIDRTSEEVQMVISPIPAKTGVTVVFNQIVSGEYTMDIVDITGRVVQSENIEVNGNMDLNIGHLPTGTYFLRLQNNEQTIQRNL